MARIEVDYRCESCDVEFTVDMDDYYENDIPECPECGMQMREIGRTQPSQEDLEEDIMNEQIR